MMLSRLHNHPFSVKAHFQHSLVLTYAVPLAELASKIPANLQFDQHDAETAFVAAAFVSVKQLRPAFFPTFLGNDFILAGYRVFVKYSTSQGKRLRGLYILGSETSSKKMMRLGSLFTQYSYSLSDLSIAESEGVLTVSAADNNLLVRAKINEDGVQLPSSSPFGNWKEARRFAGPLPFTFTNLGNKEVLIVEGVRQNWQPQPVTILEENVPFIQTRFSAKTRLASAFLVSNIPYRWKRGVIDKKP